MSNDSVIRIPVKDLNRLLTCKLCLGYFQDAHTITECMHTFCRVCITGYFDRFGDNRMMIPCPTCNTNIGYYHIAVTKLIFDRNVQSIVDKIFPPDISDSRLIEQQLLQQISAPISTNPVDEIIDFVVKVAPEESQEEGIRLPAIPKPSFKGKWDTTIKKIQKFVFLRLDESLQASLGGSEGIEILYDGQILDQKSDLSQFRSVLSIPNNQYAEDHNNTLILHYRRKHSA